MCDLNAQYSTMKDEIDNAINRVVHNSHFIGGIENEKFEESICGYFGVNYAVGVASGTDALYCALRACGIGDDDEVITTPFTFIATAESISRCGAIPIFVDIDSDTLNINVKLIERKLTNKTKAILPVHLYGQSVEMIHIMNIAKKYNLKVIEDCAQSFGATYIGKKTGTIGNASCLSFFPSKILGCYGDGGMVITNEKQVADTVRQIANHGAAVKYHHDMHGINSRLDSVQAAILNIKLKYVDEWIDSRRHIADIYHSNIANNKVSFLNTMKLNGNCYNYFTVRTKYRSKLKTYLSDNLIQSTVYYPLSLHLQPVFKGLKQFGLLNSEKAQSEVISLPMYPELSDSNVKLICDHINKYLTNRLQCDTLVNNKSIE